MPIQVETTAKTVEEVVEQGLEAIGEEIGKIRRVITARADTVPLDPEHGLQLCRYTVAACRVGREKREASKDENLGKIGDAQLDAMLAKQLAETHGVPLSDLLEFLSTKRATRVTRGS